MNTSKNYYQILGLTKNASPEDIKKSYKKLAIQYHPDKNKGDKTKEAKFKEVSEAYHTLGSADKKAQYDTQSQFGKSYNPNPFANVGGFGGGFGGSVDDIFNTFFGSGNPFGSPFARKQEYREFHENLDITVNVVISLRDVYKGKPIQVKYKRFLHCESCNGTGFDRDSESDSCEMCDGAGKDRFGRKCEYCQGLGKVFSGTCRNCNGAKIMIKDTEFELGNVYKVRASKDEFLKGYGHQSKYFREKRGNLKLKVVYHHVDDYIVDNNNLTFNLNVHYEDAINGYKYKYTALDDIKYNVDIPKKTKDGDVVRLRGKGLKTDRGREDLLFKINVIVDYDRLQKK